MPEPISVTVKHEGACVALRFDACRVALGGEFAGNVDVDVSCAAAVVDLVTENLTVQLPGGQPLGFSVGWGDRAGGVEIGFWAEESRRSQALPEHVALLWQDEVIGQIGPTLHESLPIEQVVTLTEASALLKTFPVSTVSPVLLAANREYWWYPMVAAVVFTFGFAALSLRAIEPEDPTLFWLVGGALIVTLSALGLYLARVPYRTLWLDRDRGRVLVVEGRRVELQEAAEHSLDLFDHVRLYMRWQLATSIDQNDQEIWFVTLEGPIAYAGSDGGVQLRFDSLLVGEMSSEYAARQLAAEVAYHTGLKILDTGHDQTA